MKAGRGIIAVTVNKMRKKDRIMEIESEDRNKTFKKKKLRKEKKLQFTSCGCDRKTKTL